MEDIIKLLEQYMSQNKYITCLEELYVLIEKNNLSFDEKNTIMLEVYKYNKKIHAMEERKAKHLDKLEDSKKIVSKKDNHNVYVEPSVIKKEKPVESLNCDVSQYLDKIRQLENIDELETILPSRDNEQFDNIVDLILVNLYREKVEILNLIREQEATDPEIQRFFEVELEELDFKMDALLEYKNYVEEDELLEKGENNRIIFLKNSSNEPMIMSSLKGYDEYYESFLELMNSIIEGKFNKNSRVFSNNNKIVDMMEVKGYKTRIFLGRLKDNIFVVMSSFVKKCDTDLRHRNYIINISKIYQTQKDELLSFVDNEEYIKQEEKYLEELMSMLGEKKKVNTK